MQFTGYLSKHLYGRIANMANKLIITPLEDEEVRALDSFGVNYQITVNKEGYPIYILDAQEIRTAFCH